VGWRKTAGLPLPKQIHLRVYQGIQRERGLDLLTVQRMVRKTFNRKKKKLYGNIFET